MLDSIDFYLVTDSGLSRRGTLSDVRQTVAAGCSIVQYREKAGSTDDLIAEAAMLMDICRGKAIFLVNDRVDVAQAVGADGVHLGRGDMPYFEARRVLGQNAIIGLTVHNVEEAVEAERLGADYVGLSPIFATSTKADAGAACGLGMIREVRSAISVPIVAVGGINRDNIADVIRAGADSAVAISAVVCAEDVAKEVRELRELILASR